MKVPGFPSMLVLLCNILVLPLVASGQEQEDSLARHFPKETSETSNDPVQLVGTWCDARDGCSNGQVRFWSQGNLIQGSIDFQNYDRTFTLPLTAVEYVRTVWGSVDFKFSIDCKIHNEFYSAGPNASRYKTAWVSLVTAELSLKHWGRSYPDVLHIGLMDCPQSSVSTDPDYLRQ